MSYKLDKDSLDWSQPIIDKVRPTNILAKANPRIDALLSLPRPVKKAILMGCDYAVSILSLILALSIRLGILDIYTGPISIAIYSLIPIICLYINGFYDRVTRVFFDTDMRRVLLVFVGLIAIFSIIYLAGVTINIPRSVPEIYLFILFIWLWTSRIVLRRFLSSRSTNTLLQSNKETCKIIIYGAGRSGTALFKALQASPQYIVVAFTDDDQGLVGARIFGRKIHHSKDIKDLVNRYSIEEVFLAMPLISQSRRRDIINNLTNLSVKIKELPSLQDIVEGKVTVSTMRRIDILDVLNRQTIDPDQNLLSKNIKGKNVLVTGAGGSIGSELCRQIIKNKPKRLVLYELSEYALYAIHQELLIWQATQVDHSEMEIVALLGDVKNQQKLNKVFNEYAINTVYHAAAYKHVPIVEFNPFEGIINNAKGTYHCVKAATEAQVETFVLISTDKAVRPTNIMGASKRLAELVCQGFSSQQQQNPVTKISMVRFGNVLGSSGSVVPLFTKQIAAGGPITVTHPEVTRYFMTIPEAANLVIQAGAMAQGGEVFVLNMGEPVKIVDLARRMIHLSGYEVKDQNNPDGDIEIVFNGLRPGEKLYEELIIGNDNIEPTQHALIMQAREHSFDLDDIEAILAQLDSKAQQHDTLWLKQQFADYVEGYAPGSNLD